MGLPLHRRERLRGRRSDDDADGRVTIQGGHQGGIDRPPADPSTDAEADAEADAEWYLDEAPEPIETPQDAPEGGAISLA
jgi:hypothetical protein